MAERVRITDVSPRDGLQNEPGVIATADKRRLIELLCATGVDEIEATSFVSPKWVPQLGDAAELVRGLPKRPAPLFSVLIPNEKGMQGLIEADAGGAVGKVSVFTAASETFNRKNTNATIAESVERFRPVVAMARERGLLVRGYISCVIACPFDGPIAPEQVARVAQMLVGIGVNEIDLGDTIGAGTPETTEAMLRAVVNGIGESWLAPESLTLHLHDTFGNAAACVKAALDFGVRSFDGSAAGLGGCPYATSARGERAPGNISTELLVRTIESAGFETGVDLGKLDEAAAFAREIVARARTSDVAKAERRS